VTDQSPLSFAGLLRQLRGEAKLTQEELAEAAGLSPRAVSDLERGIHPTARKDTALLLAGALGLAQSSGKVFAEAARGRLPAGEALAAIQSPGQRPGQTRPRLWSIPARNPAFTGREDLLAEVRQHLQAGHAAVAQALFGMGGVGKTQLAAEYAHLFADDYDVAWWINAEQAGLIGDQVTSLGQALGCVPAGAPSEAARAAVLAELRQQERWLLIFDNATVPADVMPWLPGGDGHVLITSRERGWDEVAAPVEVDVLTRAESIALLRHRVPHLAAADADRLAAALGDLPLALAQAAGFMVGTGTSAGQYLDLLQSRAGQLLDREVPGSYPQSLAASTAVTAAQLAEHAPAAAELASLCAFLAPEPIPEKLFTGATELLPGELAAQAADPLAWRQTLAQLAGQSLARIDQHGLQMHRLTQAILRDQLIPAEAAVTRQRTEAILAASDPGEPPDPASWPGWAELIPHVLAADLAGTDNPDLRQLVRRACWYLIERGDAKTPRDLVSHLHQQWSDRLGQDHEHTLMAAHYLAWTQLELGHYAESRDLNQDTLARRRHVLGDDHPDTLMSSHNLAVVLRLLGEAQAARDLNQDTMDRQRRARGLDDPSAMRSANNLAANLRDLGQAQAARDLDQDTLDRRRRVLGHDHPDALYSAYNLAADLRQLGELEAARDLDHDTFNRRRRVLGHDHPDTLHSAYNLAADLRELGEAQAARDLDQDTLDRRRRVLGPDHPDTLRSARGHP
jgi:transcriptional regulator with XRE-family HTH domain